MKSRRQTLRLLVASFTISVGGCSTLGDSPTRTQETPTNSPTPQDPQFSFSASMVQQATESHPPRFEASLKNEGNQSVTVKYRQFLLWPPRLEPLDKLLIFPAPDKGNVRPYSPTNGCWTQPEDRVVTEQLILNIEDLSPGDSHMETFSIWDQTKRETCYPPGEYRYEVDVRLDHPKVSYLRLVVNISISDSGTITVDTEPPEKRQGSVSR